VAVGDLNKDGKLDLVVAGQTSYLTTYISPYGGTFYETFNFGYANVLIGDGKGGFTAEDPHRLSTAEPGPIQVADFNKDGNPDMAVADQDLNSVAVLLGDGSGGLGIEADYATSAYASSLAVGDVNGDGKLDLVTPDGAGNSVGVLLGNGNGTFQAVKYTPV